MKIDDLKKGTDVSAIGVIASVWDIRSFTGKNGKKGTSQFFLVDVDKLAYEDATGQDVALDDDRVAVVAINHSPILESHKGVAIEIKGKVDKYVKDGEERVNIKTNNIKIEGEVNKADISGQAKKEEVKEKKEKKKEVDWDKKDRIMAKENATTGATIFLSACINAGFFKDMAQAEDELFGLINKLVANTYEEIGVTLKTKGEEAKEVTCESKSEEEHPARDALVGSIEKEKDKSKPIDEKQASAIAKLIGKMRVEDGEDRTEKLIETLQTNYEKDDVNDLTHAEAADLIILLQGMKETEK